MISTEAVRCPGCGVTAVQALPTEPSLAADRAVKRMGAHSWRRWLVAVNEWKERWGWWAAVLVLLVNGMTPAAILKALGVEEFIPFFGLVAATAPLSISSTIFFLSCMDSTGTTRQRLVAFFGPLALLTLLFYGLAGPPPLTPSASDPTCPTGYKAITLSAEPGAPAYTSCLPDSSQQGSDTSASLPELLYRLVRSYWLSYGPWRFFVAILTGLTLAFALSKFPLPKSFA